MPVGQKRICSFCGMDCTHQPRVKDPKGRYFCHVCYEALMRRKRGRSAATTTGESDAAHDTQVEEHLNDETAAEPRETGMSTSLNGELKHQQRDAPAPAAGSAVPTHACPQCGAVMENSAVLCIQCGHDPSGGPTDDVFIVEPSDTISPRELAGSPPAIGTALVGMFTALYFAGGMFPWIALAYVFLFGAFAIGVLIWTATSAFLDGLREGVLTLCVPLYCVYYVFIVNRDASLKWTFLAFMLGGIVFAGLWPQFEIEYAELLMDA